MFAGNLVGVQAVDVEGMLAAGAAALGVSLDSGALDQFAALLELLQTAGERLNLTAVRDTAGIVRRHFLESLALGAVLRSQGLLAPGDTLLDLGSGAGFPGLPLKLLQPQLRLVLVEATAKKADFLRSAVGALGLEATTVLAGRAETLAYDPALRESFDVVTARAVAELPALVELALPFLRLDGVLAAMKGSNLAREMGAASYALEICGGEVTGVFELAGAGETRALLVRKIGPTPDRFPRRPGQPTAHPLRARR